MTFHFSDGFDKYAADTDFDSSRGWTVSNTAETNFNATGGRTGGGALEISNTIVSRPFATKITTSITGCVAFSMKVSALPAATRTILSFENNTIAQNNRLDLRSDGKLEMYGAGALRGTSSVSLVAGEWYRLEVVIQPSFTGTFQLHINENQEISGTADFQLTVSDGHDFFDFSGASDVTITIDDLVVNDFEGAAPWNAILGDLLIETLTPDGAGSQTDFTPSTGSNWQNVDDTAHDGDSTYNSSATVDADDLFTHGNLSGTPTTIIGVVTTAIARDTGVGREIALLARENVTTGEGADQALTPTYATYQEAFEDNPDTAAAWTGAEVDAGEFGYKIGV